MSFPRKPGENIFSDAPFGQSEESKRQEQIAEEKKKSGQQVGVSYPTPPSSKQTGQPSQPSEPTPPEPKPPEPPVVEQPPSEKPKPPPQKPAPPTGPPQKIVEEKLAETSEKDQSYTTGSEKTSTEPVKEVVEEKPLEPWEETGYKPEPKLDEENIVGGAGQEKSSSTSGGLNEQLNAMATAMAGKEIEVGKKFGEAYNKLDVNSPLVSEKAYNKLVDTITGVEFFSQAAETLQQASMEFKAEAEKNPLMHIPGVITSIGASAAEFMAGAGEGFFAFLNPARTARSFIKLAEDPLAPAKRVAENPLYASRILGNIVGGYLLSKAISEPLKPARTETFELAPTKSKGAVEIKQYPSGVEARGILWEKGKAVPASTPDEIAYLKGKGEIATAKEIVDVRVTPTGKAIYSYVGPEKQVTVARSPTGLYGKATAISGSTAKTISTIVRPGTKATTVTEVTVKTGPLYGLPGKTIIEKIPGVGKWLSEKLYGAEYELTKAGRITTRSPEIAGNIIGVKETGKLQLTSYEVSVLESTLKHIKAPITGSQVLEQVPVLEKLLGYRPKTVTVKVSPASLKIPVVLLSRPETVQEPKPTGKPRVVVEPRETVPVVSTPKLNIELGEPKPQPEYKVPREIVERKLSEQAVSEQELYGHTRSSEPKIVDVGKPKASPLKPVIRSRPLADYEYLKEMETRADKLTEYAFTGSVKLKVHPLPDFELRENIEQQVNQHVDKLAEESRIGELEEIGNNIHEELTASTTLVPEETETTVEEIPRGEEAIDKPPIWKPEKPSILPGAGEEEGVPELGGGEKKHGIPEPLLRKTRRTGRNSEAREKQGELPELKWRPITFWRLKYTPREKQEEKRTQKQETKTSEPGKPPQLGLRTPRIPPFYPRKKRSRKKRSGKGAWLYWELENPVPNVKQFEKLVFG